ncbi:MAG: lysophospholipid acyltransferase family protein [bacterium]
MFKDKNSFEFAIFKFAIKIVNIIGLKNIKYFAKFLAAIFYHVLRIRRDVVIKNLQTAFPFYDSKKLREIAFNNYFSFSLTFLEAMFIPSLTLKQLHEYVIPESIEIMQNAYKKGRGVILLTAHFGNWELGAASIGSQLNIPITVLAKPQRNIYVSDWMDKMRQTFGNKVTLLGTNVREIYKVLLNKGIVGIVGDQRGPKEGSVRVKLFGQSTCTYPGTAAIALKLKSPIIVTLCYRRPDYKYNLLFEEIDLPENYSSTEEGIKYINQKYMEILEKYINLYPEQWFWMHNIWKY